MHDIERTLDDLALHLATTDVERAWVEGFIAGKRSARKQIVVAIAIGLVLCLVIWLPRVCGIGSLPS